MPAVNPYIDPGANVEAIDGSPVYFTAGLPVLQQSVVPAEAQRGIGGRLEGWLLNPDGSGGVQTHNAAGTSDNVALHVAMIVAFALVGVYVLRASGFKFVVAGSVGTP